MLTHIRIVGVLYLARGLYSMLGWGISLLGIGLLPLFVIPTPISFFGAAVAAGGLLLTLIAGLCSMLGALSLAGGLGLLFRCRWARLLVIVLAAIDLAFFPFGTLRGVYSLWTLLQEDTDRLFFDYPSRPEFI